MQTDFVLRIVQETVGASGRRSYVIGDRRRMVVVREVHVATCLQVVAYRVIVVVVEGSQGGGVLMMKMIVFILVVTLLSALFHRLDGGAPGRRRLILASWWHCGLYDFAALTTFAMLSRCC